MSSGMVRMCKVLASHDCDTCVLYTMDYRLRKQSFSHTRFVRFRYVREHEI